MPLSRNRRFASRRMSYLVFGLILFAFAFFLLSPSAPVAPLPIDTKTSKDGSKDGSKDDSKDESNSGSKYTITDIKDGIKDTLNKGKDSLTKSILNPFRQPSHSPLRTKNDEYMGTSWWADFQWLAVPFSSSITLDEDRALLPPIPNRPAVFCYYDGTLKKTTSEKNAESSLLLTWRRAWWAHGFLPIIISPSEAMNNAKYNELQRLEVDPDLKGDLMRWLAWESMGAGVLTNYTLFPMAPTHDSMLSFLRHGEFPKLTMYKGVENGLLVGQDTEVDKVLKALLASSTLKSKKSVIEIVGKDAFTVERAPKGLAYYSTEVISQSYSAISTAFSESKAKGLSALNKLVTAHLHMTWQSQFSEGIEVLQPFPNHTTIMIEPALKLAQALGACPRNPIPSSCPPNIPKCTHCEEGAKTALKITTPTQYRNTSRVFSVGTVPHPWTLAALSNLRENIDVPWIRRESPRDPWLDEITQDLLGPHVSGYLRVLRFKQAVADEGAATRAIWVTPEADIPSDIDWQFGFSMKEEVEGEKPKDETSTDDTSKADKTKDAAESSTSGGSVSKATASKESISTETALKESVSTETALKATASKASKASASKESASKTITSTESAPTESISKSSKRADKGVDTKGTKEEEKKEDSGKDKDAENKKEEAKEAKLSPEQLKVLEQSIFEKAKRVVNLSKITDESRIRTSLEAWNLADTEAWKFARAYLARRRKIRSQWEKEEAKYVGGAGSEKGRNSWSRWRDEKE